MNKTKSMRKGERGFFAFADFYGGGGQALIGVLYFFFLTNVIGLAPVLAGIVTLISEIWDAISDPLMGVISDNTKTKMGRRRPYILAGGCLLAIAFALIFLPVRGMREGWKFVYCAATYLLYNTVSTMINVSYSSMSAEISENSEERDGANVLRLVVSTASAAVCTLLPSLVLDAYNSGAIDMTALYLIVGVGFGVLFALPVILCALFVRERVVTPESKRKFRLGEIIEPLKNRPFRQLVGMYLGQSLCMDVFSTGIAMFAAYVTNPKGSVTVFLGIFIAVQLFAFPFVNKLIKKVNVNQIYGFGLPLSVVALIAFAVFGSNLYAAYACVFFVAVGFAGAQLTSWIMFPHTVDAGELLFGKRQSGSYSATMTFARKSSSALA
ncbi:MAG: MFS transporter, partial [Clostridia bacterium]|nr:MFS transporter [Clostridia bacterium]